VTPNAVRRSSGQTLTVTTDHRASGMVVFVLTVNGQVLRKGTSWSEVEHRRRLVFVCVGRVFRFELLDSPRDPGA